MLTEITRVLDLEGQAILECSRRLRDPSQAAQLEKAVELLNGALERGGKIIVTGVGKSGKVGQKIAATLCSTGSLAVYLHPTEGLHGDLGVIDKKDVVLALSYTGNTEELVRLLPALKNLKVGVIGLGGNSQSKLARDADAWIDGFVAQEACPHGLAPTSSTTLALALGDALAMALMQLRGFDAKAFAQNHPGGSLGKKLHLKVGDIMHQGAELPTVGPEASMDEVVLASTRKKLGVALVVEKERLLGIITDGDLRRALQHRERFFQLKAREIMTAGPATATPDMMALSALELMENRERKITVLPVVDDAGRCSGIIHIHDLLNAF